MANIVSPFLKTKPNKQNECSLSRVIATITKLYFLWEETEISNK